MENETNNEEFILRELEKIARPKALPIILLTLVCCGPFGNLVLDIINKEYDNLLKATVLTFPTLISIGLLWSYYIYSFKKYKYIEKDVYEELLKKKQ